MQRGKRKMGTTTVSSTIDYFREAINLLILIKETEGYNELEKRLLKRITGSKKDMNRKFALLKKIEKEAAKRLKSKEEDLNYYFGKDYKDGKNLGEIVIFWTQLCLQPQLTVEKVQNYFDSLDAEKYYTLFAQNIHEYDSSLQDVSMHENIGEIDDPIKVIRLIMNMDISQDEKWKLQHIFLEPEEHRLKVYELISIAIDVLKKFKDELEPLTKEFVFYWKEKTKDISILKLIESGMGFHFDENPHGEIITANIIMPHSLGVFTDGQNDTIDTPYDIRIGILFGDDFTLTFDNPSNDSDKHREENAVELLKLLSDNSKFQILLAIRDQKAYGSELAKKLNLTTATISHHMSALTANGLITIEKEDTKIFYKANTKKIGELLDDCREILVGKTEE